MSCWWSQLLAAVVNDFRRFIVDRRALLLGLAVPILLAAFFAKVFDRPLGADQRPVVPVDVALAADTPAARQLLELVERHSRLKVTRVELGEVDRRLESRQSVVALVLPSEMPNDTTPKIELRSHPSHELEGRLAEAAVTESVMRSRAETWLKPLGLDAASLDKAGVEWVRSSHPATANSAGFHAATHSFCGMAVQCLLFFGMETGLMLLRDRRRGVWRRMRAMPVFMSAVVAARLASASLIAFAQMGLTFMAGACLFDICFHGSPTMLLAAMGGISLLAAAGGMFVASLGGSEARSRHLSVVAILVAALLGGLWVPSLFLPEWVGPLSAVLPTTWAMRGLDAVTWQGLGSAQAWPTVAVIYGFALAGAAAALARLAAQERSLRRGASL